MLSQSQPHQTRLSELLLHSLYLQELNKSLCAKVFSALKVLTEGKGEKENPQKRKSTELNFPFNPFLLPFGTLPKRSLSKRYKELGLTTGHDGKAKVFRWGNPVHHPLRAETQIPSFAWAGDRVSTEQPHSLPGEGHIPTPTGTSTVMHDGCSGTAVSMHTCTRLRHSSKPANTGSGHGHVCPGISALLVLLPLPVRTNDYRGNIHIWITRWGWAELEEVLPKGDPPGF